MKNFFDVSDQIVCITGVSGKLGSEYAKAFLECGARVIGLDITQKNIFSLSETKLNHNYLFCKADVTNKHSLKNAYEEIYEKVGIPTVLINNAAIDSPPSAPLEENGPFEDYPETSWDKVLDVNLKGVFLCCQIFGAAMASQNQGSIINISSIYGVLSPDQNLYEYRRKRGEVFYKPVAYSASKSGILNLTRYLATYWAKKNVRVNSLTISGVFDNQDLDFIDLYCKRMPIGRMAKPDDYTGPLIFLASNASQYMTGSNLVVDGGWTAI
jgi:NAD(P)-dependent dehydrogenase (short-subunit alcohol dehydrogenase family)